MLRVPPVPASTMLKPAFKNVEPLAPTMFSKVPPFRVSVVIPATAGTRFRTDTIEYLVPLLRRTFPVVTAVVAEAPEVCLTVPSSTVIVLAVMAALGLIVMIPVASAPAEKTASEPDTQVPGIGVTPSPPAASVVQTDAVFQGVVTPPGPAPGSGPLLSQYRVAAERLSGAATVMSAARMNRDFFIENKERTAMVTSK